jgi:hypothetical protein
MFFMGDFLSRQKQQSKRQGFPTISLTSFLPAVEGGKGNDDVLGAVEGWLVAKGAPDQAVTFLRFFLNKENQTKMAAAGVHIPLTLGAETALPNPYFRRVAEAFNKSPYLQIVYDQLLAQTWAVSVNDISADLAAGAITRRSGQDSSGSLGIRAVTRFVFTNQEKETLQNTMPASIPSGSERRRLASKALLSGGGERRHKASDKYVTAALFLIPGLALFTLFVMLP